PRHRLPRRHPGRLERPAHRLSHADAVSVSQARQERPGDQQSLSTHRQVRRRPLRDSLTIHGHGGPRLRQPEAWAAVSVYSERITAKFADDLCVIRSLYTDTAAHASGCLQMNTGSVQIGKPSMGAWLS